MNRTTRWKGSFLAFSPYGPVYVEIFVNPSEQVPGAETKYSLSANGWPVIRLDKGKYRIVAPERLMDCYSESPKAV